MEINYMNKALSDWALYIALLATLFAFMFTVLASSRLHFVCQLIVRFKFLFLGFEDSLIVHF